jgi:hypothetical protein
MRMLKIAFWFFLALATASQFLPFSALADESPREVLIPETINSGLQHLLDLVDPDKKITFDPPMVAAVLDFVDASKENGAIYYSNIGRNLTSAYYDFDISASLERILEYSFNPDIPAIATMPTSARLFQWTDAQGTRPATPGLAPYFDGSEVPVVLKGLQYLEITPDLTSGAYYAYKSFQTFLCFKHRQRKVLVTVAKQADVSTVGKKGYILGEDNDWDYFYSGKTGLTLPALGWVRSYMYDSSGINIYYEIEPGAPRVRCAMFKWLRAGWSKINMVQKKHIYSGLKRFAVPFKEILEHPRLPAAAAMAADFSRITALSDTALESKMELYSRILEKRYNSGNKPKKKGLARLFANKNHWHRLSREEMESPMVIEYMKYVLGKSRSEEVKELLGLK